MHRAALLIFILAGVITGLATLSGKSQATIAEDDLLMLFQSNDAALIEERLVTKYQTTRTRAQRVRVWVQGHQPIRSLALKKNGDGLTIMPDQASHYVVIKGQYGIANLAVNIVDEHPPRSAIVIVNDDISSLPIKVPGVSIGQ